MSDKLIKALKAQKTQTQQKELEIYGTLGIPLNGIRTVEVPNRNSYVYVKLRDNQNEVVQAFNNQVASSYGLPVIVIREGNRYIVKGVNTERYQSMWTQYSPYLPRHGGSHSFSENGGGDPVWVYGRQIMPALIYPTNLITGSNVTMAPYLYNSQSGWKYVGATGTPYLFQYNPTGTDSVMVLVYLDSVSGNPQLLVNSGTHFPNNLTGTADITPFIPAVTDPYSQIPLAAVRLSSGTSLIDWSSIYDARQWVKSSSSGTGGSGGGGGGTTIITQPVPIYNNGQFIVSGTTLRLDGNVTVTASGTQAVANFPITTYFRVGQPTPLTTPTGLFWRVPDMVFASGSLGVFVQGHALIPGVDYYEQIYASGTYSYMVAQATGSYHLVHYGVPCVPQPYTPTGTLIGMVDSGGNLLVDSNGIQIVDSNGN